MNSISLISPARITSRGLRAFVVDQFNGYWNPQPHNTGVVDRNPGHVYVSVTDESCPSFDAGLAEAEIEYLTRDFGSPPKSIVYIEIGHSKGSDELAHEMLKAAQKKWGGFMVLEDDDAWTLESGGNAP